MKKGYILFLTFMVFTSCRAGTITRTSYAAQPINLKNPISIIKDTIQQQPTAYAYMPAYIEVDDQCIKLFMESYKPTLMPIIGGSGGVVVAPGSSNVLPEFVCYKNIGSIGLYHLEKDNVWRVEIDDKGGNYLYWVYTYERFDAERFIDAMYNFVKIND